MHMSVVMNWESDGVFPCSLVHSMDEDLLFCLNRRKHVSGTIHHVSVFSDAHSRCVNAAIW